MSKEVAVDLTRLDRLNTLLKSQDLHLPAFRRQVDSSFRNLRWLKKALKNTTNAELKALLDLPQHELLETF